MTASVVQFASSTQSTSPVNVTLGATPTVGNTLMALFSSDTYHTGAPTAGAGRSYTERVRTDGNGGWCVWTRLVVSGDSATTAFVPNGAFPNTLMVIEVQGTFDKIGTPLHQGANATNIAPTGLTPASADNIVFAVVGAHGITTAAMSGGAADNGFTITSVRFPATTGSTLCGLLAAHKVTGSTAATGTTTVSWSNGQVFDRDAVQIAFTGVTASSTYSVAGSAAAVSAASGAVTPSSSLSAAGVAATTSAASGAVTSILKATGSAAAASAVSGAATKLWRSWRTVVSAALIAKTMSTLVIGDSISEGQGASTRGNRWVDKMNDALKAVYQPAGVTGAVTGYLPGYYEASGIGQPYSGRSGSTTEYAASSLGERSVRMTSAGTQTYTVTGTSADLYAAAGGSYSWKVDGGPATNITPGANSKTTISLGSAGSHTITITWVSGTVTFGGVMVYNGDETTGIRVVDASHFSWKTSDFDSSLDSLYNVVSPDLIILSTGVNDDVLPAAQKALIVNKIADIRAACTTKEPGIVVGVMYQPFGRTDWAACAAALESIATDDPTVGLIDWWAAMGTVPNQSGTGYWNGDGLHPNDSGHAFMGALAASTLQLTTAQVAGTASGVTTAQGAVTAIRLVTSTVAGVSSAVGAVNATFALAGTASATSTASAAATRITSPQPVAGTAPATSGTAGAVSLLLGVSGAADVLSTTTGAASRIPLVASVTGATGSVSGASGAVTVIGGAQLYQISGSVAAVSDSMVAVGYTNGYSDSYESDGITSILQAAASAAAASAAAVDVSRVSLVLSVTGTASTVSGVNGTTSAILGIAGATVALSTATGAATRVPLSLSASGTAAAASGATGAVNVIGGAQAYPAVGTVAVTSAAAGAVTSILTASGAAAGTSTVTGSAGRLLLTLSVSGTAAAISAAAGSASVIGGPQTYPMAGTFAAVSSSTGTVTVIVAPQVYVVSAVAAVTSVVTGAVTTSSGVTGLTVSLSGATGSVTIYGAPQGVTAPITVGGPRRVGVVTVGTTRGAMAARPRRGWSQK